jgi:hypothetical protein
VNREQRERLKHLISEKRKQIVFRENRREASINYKGSDRPTYNRVSQHKGVIWDNDRNKWKAQISINQKTTFIGRYDTEQEAIDAYNDAERKRRVAKEAGATVTTDNLTSDVQGYQAIETVSDGTISRTPPLPQLRQSPMKSDG